MQHLPLHRGVQRPIVLGPGVVCRKGWVPKKREYNLMPLSFIGSLVFHVV